MKLLSQARFHRGIISVRFHPSGRVAAAASNDGWIACWTLGNRGRLSSLWEWRMRRRTYARTFNNIAFSPNGQLLVASGMCCPVRLWQISKHGKSFAIEPSGQFTRASYSTLFLDDRHLLICQPTDEPRPVIFDLEIGAGFEGQLWSHFAAQHPEGGLILRSAVWPSATSEVTFVWWDREAPAATEEELAAGSNSAHTGLVCSGSTGGQLSRSPHVEVDVTDAEGGYMPVGPVAFHPSGNQFATLSGMPDRFFLQVFDFPSCRPLYQRRYELSDSGDDEDEDEDMEVLFDEELIGSRAERLLYLPSGQLMLPTPEGDVVVLDSQTGDEIERHRVHNGFLATLDYDPERQRLLTGWGRGWVVEALGIHTTPEEPRAKVARDVSGISRRARLAMLFLVQFAD